MKKTVLILAVAGSALVATASGAFARSVANRAMPAFSARVYASPVQPRAETPYNVDGSYKSLSAYEHSVFGTPCGMECATD